MNPTFIYALKCPKTGQIRYVGKADSPYGRLEAHLQPDTTNVAKKRWIAELVSAGYVPEVVLLEEVDLQEWKEAERRWIVKLRAEGHDLTNVAKGGEGAERQAKKKVSKNFRLSDEALVALKHLSGRWGVSQGKAIEILVREAAIEEKVLEIS